MAIDYEVADYTFAESDAPAMANALMAKVTIETTETPQDYSGVPVKRKTVEKIPLPSVAPPPLMPGPAPMMVATMPPGIAELNPYPSLPPGAGNAGMVLPPAMPGAGAQPMPGGGSLGIQAAEQAMMNQMPAF
jgi:hypothetical protein|tara:strand:- start:83 stop:481 length:399 start_codon:yes stop_codon:yes gene_type:complete